MIPTNSLSTGKLSGVILMTTHPLSGVWSQRCQRAATVQSEPGVSLIPVLQQELALGTKPSKNLDGDTTTVPLLRPAVD